MAKAFATVFSLSEYEVCPEQDSKASESKYDDDSHGKPASESSLLRMEDGDNWIESAPSRSVVTRNTTCLTCGISSFGSVLDQREHFKTDWHRYNVKMRVENKPSIAEEDFNAMIERDDDVGSISGSDRDDYDVDVDIDVDNEYGDCDRTGREGLRGKHGVLSPYYILCVGRPGRHQENCEDDQSVMHVGVWKCLLVPDYKRKERVEEAFACDAYKKIASFKSESQQWAVLMLQGGHFAGCVYRIQYPSTKDLQESGKAVHEVADACITEINHKSFHRYIVRAKAGGKQSDKDATGKVAKSAGSRLRRYNEAVLQKEILATLDEWRGILSECTLIFVSTPGSNRLVLFGGDSPPLDKTDERIRKIPFVTRRPTISETKRVVRTLLTLYTFKNEECQGTLTLQGDAVGTQRSEKQEAQRHDSEQKRHVAKLELQRQEEIGKERNRRKKERQREQRRKLKILEKEDIEDGKTEVPECEEQNEAMVDIDAELKNLAAAVAASQIASRTSYETKESKARSKIPPEDHVSRREKMAAAAEARAKALAAACSSQKLY